ncbi:hypothetical protein DLC15_09180, partial [Salmonella enterica subsp. enterica serovar Telelkebir]|nr:hypothetical protein [Salmonella enterica subsp. enterica serovar Telelkebir]
MKKILSGIVLSLGLVGAANANTYYACNTFSETRGKIDTYLTDGTRFYHAPSGQYRPFFGVKVRVNDERTNFAFNAPTTDTTVKSGKLTDLDGENIGLKDKSIYMNMKDEDNPLFYYKKGDETYIIYGCREIL